MINNVVFKCFIMHYRAFTYEGTLHLKKSYFIHQLSSASRKNYSCRTERLNAQTVISSTHNVTQLAMLDINSLAMAHLNVAVMVATQMVLVSGQIVRPHHVKVKS